jgi:hypothetical protein
MKHDVPILNIDDAQLVLFVSLRFCASPAPARKTAGDEAIEESVSCI